MRLLGQAPWSRRPVEATISSRKTGVANRMKVRSTLPRSNATVPVVSISMFMLVSCTIPMELNFQRGASSEFLDGNYLRLAECSYERLGGAKAQLTKTDLP